MINVSHFKMRPHNILSCILVASLAGCATSPLYERPALPTSESYPGMSGAQASLEVDQLGWPDYFADPVLYELIRQAVENNRDLQMAMRRVEEARAQFGIQRADQMPSIGAGALFSRSRTPDDLSLPLSPSTTSDYTVALGLSEWELDFWGRVRSLKEAALESYLASNEARRAVVVSLVAQVANTYLFERELDERVDIAQRTIISREESYRIARRRYEVGSAPKLDSAQAESLLNQTRADLAVLQRLRDLNRNALTLLIGIPVSPDARPLSEIEPGFVRDIPAGLPSDLLNNRPDILAAERRLKAGNANIEAARAAFYPRITLTGALGTASDDLSSLFTSGNQLWNFTPRLSLPIFTGGRLRSNLDLATARRDGAVAEYERTIQVAFREVADALAERHWLAEQVTAQEATLAAHAERLRLARLRYEAGAAPYLEVLDAERDQFQAEQALVQGRRSLLASSVNLYAALGGGALDWAGPKAPVLNEER